MMFLVFICSTGSNGVIQVAPTAVTTTTATTTRPKSDVRRRASRRRKTHHSARAPGRVQLARDAVRSSRTDTGGATGCCGGCWRQPMRERLRLRWEPEVDFTELVHLLVDADLERLRAAQAATSMHRP